MGAQFTKPSVAVPTDPPAGWFGARMTPELLDRLYGREAPPEDLRPKEASGPDSAAAVAVAAAAAAPEHHLQQHVKPVVVPAFPPASFHGKELNELLALRDWAAKTEDERVDRLSASLGPLEARLQAARAPPVVLCDRPRQSVAACYRDNAADPLVCADAVQEFVRCANAEARVSSSPPHAQAARL